VTGHVTLQFPGRRGLNAEMRPADNGGEVYRLEILRSGSHDGGRSPSSRSLCG
jgi:hypothetical protein